MKNFKNIALVSGALVLSVWACKEEVKTSEAAPDFLASHVDTTVNPAEDFFTWCNGLWFKNNPIPASETSWGIGDMVQEEIYARLKTINADAVKANAASGTDTRRIGDFWSTGMDSVKADQLGYQPLKPWLDKINGIASYQDVVKVMTEMEPLRTGIFYGGLYIGQDAKNSEKMTAHLWQGGLGLPNRDYYFNDDERTKGIREAYPAFIVKMLTLTGTPADQAESLAKGVFEFEKSLASSSRKLEDLRDPYANYNKMSVAEASTKLTPVIDWKNLYSSNGLPAVDTVIVGQPEFFTNLNAKLKTTSPEVLKAYMRFHLVVNYASYLSKEIDDASFDFYDKRINGAQEQRVRWKRVLDAEEGAMGMILGKLFVAEYFPEKTKKRYSDLVESIRTVYAERIKALTWMSDTTKQKALDKLQKMNKKVGYPDKWKDYSALEIGTASYCDNMMNATRWQFNDMISKFGKPIDRTEWEMTPQTYNAYYNPSNNEIVLPAAIFTIPGVPDSLVDDAVVFGYAGASTIGHEITHGFDDEGRNFDAAGNLVSWWTSSDEERFKVRADVMVKQFNDYEPLPGKHINGEATLGENIADYGGILLGIDAFKQTEQYKKGEKIGGYTPMQRYFMGYALGWMIHHREEALANRLLTDVHSPAKYRVNGPFANIPVFYESFNVKEGDQMWRPDSLRVQIW